MTASSFVRLCAVICMSAVAASTSALAADYTVTPSSPDFIDFSSVGLEPGDTIWLEGHTRQRLVLQNIHGTADRPITITNRNGQFVIQNTDPNDDKGLHFYNCRHVVVKGTPDPGNFDYGIRIASMERGSGVAFVLGSTDFEIHHVEIGHTGFAGIIAKSDSLNRNEFTMRNVSIHDCYIHNTGGEGLYIGSSFYHSSNDHEIHGLEIHHNLVIDAGWDGIQVGAATQDVVIRDNTIIGFGKTTTDVAQNKGMRINPGTAALIYNNWIEGTAGAGTGLFANPHNDSAYFNNVIINPGGDGIHISVDAAAVPGATIKLLNNTIVAPAAHGIYFWSLGSADNLAANNLIVAAGGESIKREFPEVDLTESANVFAPTAGGAGFVDASAGDYRLTASSPAVDAGADLAAHGVTWDFDGISRPFGPAFDAGAFERAYSVSGEPAIAAQPEPRHGLVGDTVTFSVIAVGDQPLTFQWFFDGNTLPDATDSTLTLANVQLADAGLYHVTVTNFLGSATSTSAGLTVSEPPPMPPAIGQQPASQTVDVGADVTFLVTASGDEPLAFQWKKDGVDLPGANASSLTLTNVQLADAGSYSVVVTNGAGSATSAAALLTVNALPGQPTVYSAATIVADATVADHVNPARDYTHAVNFNANATVTVNGVPFAFGTGNSGGAQPELNYSINSFNNVSSTFNSTATGDIHALLATRGTNAGASVYTLTLGGLTAGKTYTFALFNDSSHGAGRNWHRVAQSVDSTTFDVDFSAGGVNSSRVIAVTYTATGPSVTFTFTRLTGVGTTGTGSWIGFAGFVNYESPPPGTAYAVATIVNDQTVAPRVDPSLTYTHAININGNAPVLVNGLEFGFGTGNGGGAQPAKGYTMSTFNNAITTFNSTATGEIRAVLARRATNTSSATYTLTLTGLTAGTDHVLALFTDSSHGPGRNWYRISQDIDSSTFDLDFSASGVGSSRMTSVFYRPASSSVTFTFTRLDGIGSPGVTSSSSWVGFAGFVNHVLPAKPTIVESPVSNTADAGTAVFLTVVARGEAPLTYQWSKDGAPIPGATGSFLPLSRAQPADSGVYSVTVTNAHGSATSAAATITINPLVAPTVTTHPVSQAVEAGANVEFTVVATGSAPLVYQWTKDGEPLAGATGTTLSLTDVQLADAGDYAVTVSNAVGAVASNPATLSVALPPPAPPAITTQPASQSVEIHLTAKFTVVATGTAPLSYQWVKDGEDIAGATGATLTLPWVELADAGSYAVTITNEHGSAVSEPAVLSIVVPRQTAERATVPGQFDFNFLLYLPDGYDPADSAEWPLLVFLHGYGERSTTEADPMDPVHLAKLKTYGPPLRVAQGAGFPMIIVSPQCSGAWWDGAQLENFILWLQDHYRVDRTRILLTGLSMGGFGVWDLVQRQPSRYAAIAPISAAPQVDPANSAAAERLYDLPIWVFHGANDPLYSVGDLQAYLDVIRNAGGNPQVTIYTSPPGNGHNAWVPAYANDGLYAWFLAQSAAPPAITDPPADASTTFGSDASFSVGATGRRPLMYQWMKDGIPIPGATDATLVLENIPMSAAGEYTVKITNGVGEATSAPATLSVAPAPAAITLHQLEQTYDGLPKPVTAETAPAGLAVNLSYDGSSEAPTQAGSYTVTATINELNFVGTVTDTLTIARATPVLLWEPPAPITYGTPLDDTQLNATADVAGTIIYSPAAGTILDAGTGQALAATFLPADAANYHSLEVSTTITVHPATAAIAISDLNHLYDGAPKAATVTTVPSGLLVNLAYDGLSFPPVYPGVYAVTATVNGGNYTGVASAELVINTGAVVRHAPTLNGAVDGSLQLLTGENVTLNGSAWISGDLLVPGTPAVQLNGAAYYHATLDADGAPEPSDYTITLNGGALLRHVVRRITPFEPVPVPAPPTPTGTTNVTLNQAHGTVGNWSNLRNLTVNHAVGPIVVPPGTYGNFTANGGDGFVFGTSGSAETAVYHLQSLTLNGGSNLRIDGPVEITLAQGLTLNGAAGSLEHPERLVLRIHSGGLTLNGNATFGGLVIAPNGAVTINGNSTLCGRVVCDKLTINGNGLLSQNPETE